MPLTAAGDAKEIFAGSPIGVSVYGGIYFLPDNVVIPTDAKSAIPSGAVHLGYVNEEGITITSERAGDPVLAWGGDKIAYLQKSFGLKWKLKLLQFFNPDAARAAYGNANVLASAASASEGNLMAIKQNAAMLDTGCYVIDSFYGKKKVREVAPFSRVTEVGDVKLVHTALSELELTIDLFPDENGNAAYRYTDDGEKTGGTKASGEASTNVGVSTDNEGVSSLEKKK